ncbi:MAG: hypothetical protein JWN84_948 [Nocardioides sp.]|nr:hypothetical protein [Nocardioides sp.]
MTPTTPTPPPSDSNSDDGFDPARDDESDTIVEFAFAGSAERLVPAHLAADVEVLRRLRTSLTSPAPVPVGDLAAYLTPSATSAGTATTGVAPAIASATAPADRSRKVVRGPAAWFVGLGLAAQVGLGSAAAAAGIVAAGAADVLPGPIQNAFDAVVEVVRPEPPDDKRNVDDPESDDSLPDVVGVPTDTKSTAYNSDPSDGPRENRTRPRDRDAQGPQTGQETSGESGAGYVDEDPVGGSGSTEPVVVVPQEPNVDDGPQKDPDGSDGEDGSDGSDGADTSDDEADEADEPEDTPDSADEEADAAEDAAEDALDAIEDETEVEDRSGDAGDDEDEEDEPESDD